MVFITKLKCPRCGKGLLAKTMSVQKFVHKVIVTDDNSIELDSLFRVDGPAISSVTGLYCLHCSFDFAGNFEDFTNTFTKPVGVES